MPTTHDSSPSRSRKPIERTRAPMSSPIARIAASPASPGSIVTTRKMAAVVKGASTFCASGAVLSAGGCMIDRPYRDPDRGGQPPTSFSPNRDLIGVPQGGALSVTVVSLVIPDRSNVTVTTSPGFFLSVSSANCSGSVAGCPSILVITSPC